MVSYMSANCQINQDFNNSDLSTWSGDTDRFIINADLQLQLSDIETGTSSIYTETTYGDSTVWTMDVSLDFSPSASNRLQVWLAIDDTDIVMASGYILEIGENGSDDAIRLVEVIDGNTTNIASGIIGNVGSAFDYTIQLIRDSKDVWTLRSKPVDDITFTQEFSLQYSPQVDFNSLKFFGFNCSYSATRADKFFFDNIIVEDLTADETAPQITDVDIIAEDQIRITFDEAVDNVSASMLSNYAIDPTLRINSVSIDANTPYIIDLILDDPLPSGAVTVLTVMGISDDVGNVMSSTSFDLRLTETAELGDLLINEILFDPFPDGEDFVEVINISDKFINLKGLIIENNTNQQSQDIEEDIILLPTEMIAFSENIDFLIDTYEPISEALLYEQDLPAFNNSDGNVTIKINDGTQDIIIDTYDFDEDHHLTLISDTEGISLERISTTAESNNPSNWTSSSEANRYATPGYTNSALVETTASSDDVISLAYKVFSPNADSYRDNLIINYNLDKAGYIANITVHDDKGRQEIPIAENALIGTQGFYRWDGTNEDGILSPVGMYIINIELYHSDGDIIKEKKVCVLGQQLD